MSVWEDRATMWTLAATVHRLLAAALLLASGLQSLTATEDDVTPRISFPYSKSKWLSDAQVLQETLGYCKFFKKIIDYSQNPCPEQRLSNHKRYCVYKEFGWRFLLSFQKTKIHTWKICYNSCNFNRQNHLQRLSTSNQGPIVSEFPKNFER